MKNDLNNESTNLKTNGTDDILFLDFNKIISGITLINDTIISNNNSEYQNINVTSTAAVLSSLFNSEAALLNISTNLEVSINDEMKLIGSASQKIYDLDQKLKQDAIALDDRINIESTNEYNELQDLFINNYFQPIIGDSSNTELLPTRKGKVGTINIDDINSIINQNNKLTGNLYNNLELDRQNAKNLKNNISTFTETITSTNQFGTNIGKIIANDLEDYQLMLDIRIASDDKLQQAFEEAIKLIKEYVKDSEINPLDDSKIPELKDRVENLKDEIKNLESKIKETKSIKTVDELGKVTFIEVPMYSQSEISNMKNTISDLNELIEKLTKEIELLEGLPIVINQAQEIINQAMLEINQRYKQFVDEKLDNRKNLNNTLMVPDSSNNSKVLKNLITTPIRLVATINNTRNSAIFGTLDFFEGIYDLGTVVLGAIDTPLYVLYDVGKNIITWDWNFDTTKNKWNEIKEEVAHSYADDFKEFMYDGNNLAKLAYEPFQPDGIGNGIVEKVSEIGTGIVVGQVAIPVQAADAWTKARTIQVGSRLDILSTLGEGFQEGWNNNDLSIPANGKVMTIPLTYDELKELEQLSTGDTFIKETYSIMNNNGTYIYTDSNNSIQFEFSNSITQGSAIGGITKNIVEDEAIDLVLSAVI